MDDVISAGPDRPRRPLPRWLVIVAVLAAAVAVAAFGVRALRGDANGPATAAATTGATPPGSSAATAASSSAAMRCSAVEVPVGASWTDAAGLAITGAAPGSTLTRRDTSAEAGPWSVVVRRGDGSLGSNSAVVTFPVAAPRADDSGDVVDIRGVQGVAGADDVVWAVSGGYARVHGDLGRATLLAIAERTTVAGDRPVVRAPEGLAVGAVQTYRPVEIHEVRYGGGGLGPAGAVLGFVYTGVLRGGAFEDALLGSMSIPGGSVQGHPAVVTELLGGSGVLAWSPAPGVTAYVGYSGDSLDDETVEALGCLAQRAQPMSAADWQASAPSISDQSNSVG